MLKKLNQSSKLIRHLGILILIIGILLTIGQLPIRAQNSSLSFRVARLESDNTRLKSRISQLESQLNRLSRAAGISVPPPAETPPPIGLDESALATDPMFERLSTLVIETRQDVLTLQTRLDILERQLSSQFNFQIDERQEQEDQ